MQLDPVRDPGGRPPQAPAGSHVGCRHWPLATPRGTRSISPQRPVEGVTREPPPGLGGIRRRFGGPGLDGCCIPCVAQCLRKGPFPVLSSEHILRCTGARCTTGSVELLNRPTRGGLPKTSGNKKRCVKISWSTTLRYGSHMSNVSGRDFGFASWSYSYGQNGTLGEWAE